MNQIEQRLVDLIVKEMDAAEAQGWSAEGRTLDWNATLSDYGLNSMIGVQFLKSVSREFNVEIPVEEARKMACLRDLADFIESHE